MRAAKPVEEIRLSHKVTKKNGGNTVKQLLKNFESPTMVSGTDPDNITLLNRAFSLDERIVKTVRKDFFETPNGDAMCSTSVVISTSATLAVTAAHCVYDFNTHR
jgi:hypothetical protein